VADARDRQRLLLCHAGGRLLPNDLPPWGRFTWFAAWRDDGRFERIPLIELAECGNLSKLLNERSRLPSGRLPAARRAQRRSREADYPQRVRLDEPLSVDCRSGAHEQRHRWRGGGARSRRHSRFQRAAFTPARRRGLALRLRAPCARWRGFAPPPLEPAQDQSGAATRATARRHFRRTLRAGEIGPDLFRAACNMGLEGLVSKRVDRPYRAGRSPDWVKVKNRKHPAMERVKDAFA
jgi:hypothetical protein